MNDESVLGIDIGTASTKAVLAHPDGRVIAQAQRPHSLSLPRPGWAEHDAEKVWWHDVLAVCADLAPLAGGGLRGVCVSGIGPCVVPCDARLRPLRQAILYGIDTRATAEADELSELYGVEPILARGGSTLSSQALGPKLLWLRRQEPDIWARTAGWYMASSFVTGHLTGSYVLDRHSASQCDPLYDLRAGDWAHDWADEVAAGVPLPELVWPGEQIGSITGTAAQETGLPAGTPVLAGTIDAWAEAFSVGIRNPGDLMLMYGSTMFFVSVLAHDARSPLLWCTEGVEPGRRTFAAGMATSGALTDWLRALFGNPPWQGLVEGAAAVPPGARGLLLLPYFAGERTPLYDPDARGVVAGLNLSHGPAELLRAAYEGTAYGVRQVLDTFAAAEAVPDRLVAVGGGTRSRLWPQIVSDVLGRPQTITEVSIGAAYGDALLAAIGSGLAAPEADWSVAAAEVAPQPDAQLAYEELFGLYGQLYPQTRSIMHRLAGIQKGGDAARQGPSATLPERRADDRQE